MSVNRLLLSIAFVFCISFLTISCGSSTSSKEKMEEVDKSGPEYTSAYVCPMHCEGSGSDSAGTCPVCGMAYVENTDHTGDESGSHEGHNH